MLDRSTLVVQMAKAFVGEGIMDPDLPAEDIQEGAERACRGWSSTWAWTSNRPARFSPASSTKSVE